MIGAGCQNPAGEPAPRRRWEQLIREPGPIARPTWEVAIPTRDGIELAADIYLPAKRLWPVPVIANLNTPYDKQLATRIYDAELFRSHGYGFVINDARGRGKSEGDWTAFVNDGRDGFDVVEWIAAQPWSTGKIGTTGVSYSGWTQWAAAMEQPPHLRCMASFAAAGRFMQEIPSNAGVLQLYTIWWLYWVGRRLHADLSTIDWRDFLMRLPIGAMEEALRPLGSNWLNLIERDTLDDFWAGLRFDGCYDRITIPCLHVGGWFDVEDLLGTFHHFEQAAGQSPVKDQQKLIVGPWSHTGTRFPDSTYGAIDFGTDAIISMDATQVRFFDRWLKGIENGAESDPPVALFETGSNVWRIGSSWPEETRVEKLHLSAAGDSGLLSRHRPAQLGSWAYLYDPARPATTDVDVTSAPEPSFDQTRWEERTDVLSFTSTIFTGDLSVCGWPQLELFASSDCTDTDWHVRLSDVHPDGRSIRVASGCQRASYRDSLTEPSPLDPGTVYRFLIEMTPLTHAFLAGHRLRLSITSSDFPWFARNLNQFGPISRLRETVVALNTLYGSAEHPSQLNLPLSRGTFTGDDGCFSEP